MSVKCSAWVIIIAHFIEPINTGKHLAWQNSGVGGIKDIPSASRNFLRMSRLWLSTYKFKVPGEGRNFNLAWHCSFTQSNWVKNAPSPNPENILPLIFISLPVCPFSYCTGFDRIPSRARTSSCGQFMGALSPIPPVLLAKPREVLPFHTQAASRDKHYSWMNCSYQFLWGSPAGLRLSGHYSQRQERSRAFVSFCFSIFLTSPSHLQTSASFASWKKSLLEKKPSPIP